eukprot:7865699-Alexandrium_andersonii.AAC.1
MPLVLGACHVARVALQQLHAVLRGVAEVLAQLLRGVAEVVAVVLQRSARRRRSACRASPPGPPA